MGIYSSRNDLSTEALANDTFKDMARAVVAHRNEPEALDAARKLIGVSSGTDVATVIEAELEVLDWLSAHSEQVGARVLREQLLAAAERSKGRRMTVTHHDLVKLMARCFR